MHKSRPLSHVNEVVSSFLKLIANRIIFKSHLKARFRLYLIPSLKSAMALDFRNNLCASFCPSITCRGGNSARHGWRSIGQCFARLLSQKFSDIRNFHSKRGMRPNSLGSHYAWRMVVCRRAHGIGVRCNALLLCDYN